jgi:hypothetical protein
MLELDNLSSRQSISLEGTSTAVNAVQPSVHRDAMRHALKDSDWVRSATQAMLTAKSKLVRCTTK